MRIFFDTEFTGLYKDTDLISIGLVAENGERFYAEFSDYDRSKVDEWINKNVIKNLLYREGMSDFDTPDWMHWGDKKFIEEKLRKWLQRFSKVEMWSDCLAYDWVLFNDLFGSVNGVPDLPKNVYYIPFDICTLFEIKGVDPDIDREKFAKKEIKSLDLKKHNSLYDAYIIRECYFKLLKGNY